MSEHTGSEQPSQIVVSGSSHNGRDRFIKLANLFRRRVFWVAAAVLIVVLVGVYFLFIKSDKPRNNVKQISYTQYAKQEVNKLNANVPDKSKPPAYWANYYSYLLARQYDSGDYNGVIDTLGKLIKVDPGATLTDDTPYTVGADAYVKLGDKTKAKEMLDKARVIDNRIQDTLQKQELLRNIDEFQGRLGL
jgi:tetratricopeptide (TPR) repeat protein